MAIEGKPINFDDTGSGSATKPIYIDDDGKVKFGSEYVAKTGGTFTGAITFQDNIILSSASYGTTLPAAGTPGRIFFLKQST